MCVMNVMIMCLSWRWLLLFWTLTLASGSGQGPLVHYILAVLWYKSIYQTATNESYTFVS